MMRELVAPVDEPDLKGVVVDVDYSIVIPVYYNEGCLRPLVQALYDSVFNANPNRTGEIVFIDDGSGDGSLKELLEMQAKFPEIISIIKLTRNFGQGGASLAGYEHARGKCVITMAADGQEPPEVINQMLKGFFEENFDVVVAMRASRDESLYRKITSRIYFSLMRRLTFKNMPEGGFDFWLMSRRAVETFLRNLDAHPSGQGQVLWMGFPTKYISYHRRARLAGVSRWTFAKKFTSFLDGILAYSFAPIRFISLAGCVFSLLGFVYAGLILIDGLFLGNPVKGWSPLMIMILVMGGFQMVMLGIIGEYLWRTLAQVRRRDMFLIDKIFEADPSGGSRS
jgi:glycosyltransferase involved in cell wall biosynthesis